MIEYLATERISQGADHGRHPGAAPGAALVGIVDITDVCRALLQALQAAEAPPP